MTKELYCIGQTTTLTEGSQELHGFSKGLRSAKAFGQSIKKESGEPHVHQVYLNQIDR